MIPARPWSHGPFTVVECDSGEELRFDTLADATAFALCMENNLPLIVFGAEDEGAILRIVRGEKIGTLVGSSA